MGSTNCIVWLITHKRELFIMYKALATISLIAGAQAGSMASCDAETLAVCDQAYENLCIDRSSICGNDADCLIDMEGFYQEALQTIYQTAPEGCECEQASCIDWSNVSDDGSEQLDSAEQSQLEYLEALFDKMQTLNEQMENGDYDGLEGSPDNNLVLLLLIKKMNHNPLVKILLLKKKPFSNSSGVVKLLIFKKLFGSSTLSTIIKLKLLTGGDSSTEQELQETSTRGRLGNLILFKKIFGSSTLKKLFILKALGSSSVSTQAGVATMVMAIVARLF